MAEAVSGPSNDYWIAAATVLPIIALGVLAEAREAVKQWRAKPEEYPSFVKYASSILWLAYIFLAGFAVPACMRALRGEHVSSHWPRVIELTIGGGLLSVTFTPMVGLILRSTGVVKVMALLMMPARMISRLRAKASMERQLDEISRARHRAIAFLAECQIIDSRLQRALTSGQCSDEEVKIFTEGREKYSSYISTIEEALEKADRNVLKYGEFRVRLEEITSLPGTLDILMKTVGDDFW